MAGGGGQQSVSQSGSDTHSRQRWWRGALTVSCDGGTKGGSEPKSKSSGSPMWHFSLQQKRALNVKQAAADRWAGGSVQQIGSGQ